MTKKIMWSEYDSVTNTQPYSEDLGVRNMNSKDLKRELQRIYNEVIQLTEADNKILLAAIERIELLEEHAEGSLRESGMGRHVADLTRAIYDVGEIDKCNACGKAVVSLIDSGESPYCRECAAN